MTYILPFILAMAATMVTLPLFERLARKWGIVDQPSARKVHLVPIARIGGLAMAAGVLVAAGAVLKPDAADRYFLLACGVVTLFGALDDRFDLDYRIKLAAQLVAAGIVIFAGDVQIHALTLNDSVLLPEWLSLPLTLVFLVGITNAINLADGLDGLAGGTTFLSLCAIALLAYGGGQFASAALTLAFAGAILGFLRFNTFPASVFMGDAGSQMLGFAVGVLSIRATQNGSSVVSAATPVLLLALPILDTLSVMVQRISEGRSPFSADKNHIHHKLLGFGFGHHEAVMVIYAIQADLFLMAYWMRYESDLIILLAVSIFFLLAIGLIQWATRSHWRFRSGESQYVARLLRPDRLPRWSYIAVALAVAGYAALVVPKIDAVSIDIKWLLVGLLAVGVAGLAILRGGPLNIFEKCAFYVTAALLVYFDTLDSDNRWSVVIVTWTLMIVAAAATMLRMRFAADRQLKITPLDLIVLFVALVIPSLPGSIGLPHGGSLAIAKVVILFYAVEVLVTRLQLEIVWLRIGAVSVLAGLIVRPML